LLLGQHKLFKALLLDAVGDLVWESGGGSSLFGIEGKGAEVVEACPFDEIEEFVKACVCFAGEADDESCSQGAMGHFCS